MAGHRPAPSLCRIHLFFHAKNKFPITFFLKRMKQDYGFGWTVPGPTFEIYWNRIQTSKKTGSGSDPRRKEAIPDPT